ncbi:MAG: hypothetical protein ACLU38_02070 [Dysosmobacter sp.]
MSRALALQSGGIYYWFKDKDDVVVTCAEEEAALRLEGAFDRPGPAGYPGAGSDDGNPARGRGQMSRGR